MKFKEIVYLTLKDVTFRHPEYKKLEEFLVREYKFDQIEDKEYKISNSINANEKRSYYHKRYECNAFDAKIELYILGNVSQEEDTCEEVLDKKQYTIYTAKYEMIKFACESGWVLQQLCDRLVLHLGLDTVTREWFFERIEGN